MYMPIAFIMSGVGLIMLIFNVTQIKNKFNLMLYKFVSFFVLISFYVKYVNIHEVYFNYFQVLLLILIAIYTLTKFKLNLKCILVASLCPILYFCLLSIDTSLLLSYNSLVFSLVALLPLIFTLNTYESVFLVILNLLTMGAIDIRFELFEFSFCVVNTNLFFDLVFICLLVNFMQNQFVRLFNFRKENCYEKNFCNIIACSNNVCNVLK